MHLAIAAGRWHSMSHRLRNQGIHSQSVDFLSREKIRLQESLAALLAELVMSVGNKDPSIDYKGDCRRWPRGSRNKAFRNWAGHARTDIENSWKIILRLETTWPWDLPGTRDYWKSASTASAAHGLKAYTALYTIDWRNPCLNFCTNKVVFWPNWIQIGMNIQQSLNSLRVLTG